MRHTILCLGMAALMTAAPLPAGGVRVLIELEDYSASLNVGGTPLFVVQETACTGGALLKGLDAPGDWAEYELSAGPLGSWVMAIRVRGDDDVRYFFDVTFTGARTGTTQSITVEFVGQGYG